MIGVNRNVRIRYVEKPVGRWFHTLRVTELLPCHICGVDGMKACVWVPGAPTVSVRKTTGLGRTTS